MELPSHASFYGGYGSVYVERGPAWTDDRHTYVRALRRYPNFRFPPGLLELTPDDESLAVLVRVPKEGTVAAASALSFELRSVLALPGMPWFLKPLDVIDRSEVGPVGPWLVVADPHAVRAAERDPTPADGEPRVAVAFEALVMLEALHDSGLEVGPMTSEDFLIDATGRWSYLGSDRVRRTGGRDSVRNDLVGWARWVDGWLDDQPRAGGTVESRGDAAARLRGLVRRCLADPGVAPSCVAELVRGTGGLRQLFRTLLRSLDRGGAARARGG